MIVTSTSFFQFRPSSIYFITHPRPFPTTWLNVVMTMTNFSSCMSSLLWVCLFIFHLQSPRGSWVGHGTSLFECLLWAFSIGTYLYQRPLKFSWKPHLVLSTIALRPFCPLSGLVGTGLNWHWFLFRVFNEHGFLKFLGIQTGPPAMILHADKTTLFGLPVKSSIWQFPPRVHVVISTSGFFASVNGLSGANWYHDFAHKSLLTCPLCASADVPPMTRTIIFFAAASIISSIKLVLSLITWQLPRSCFSPSPPAWRLLSHLPWLLVHVPNLATGPGG